MNILEIEVDGLYDLYSYKIPFYNDEGITIIYGPNGYGKTTILKLIKDIINGNITEINFILFKRFKILFDNNFYIEVIKQNNERNNMIYKINDHVFENELNKYQKENINDFHIPVSVISEYIPYLKRVGPRFWIDIRTNQRLSYDEIIDTYSDLFFINKELYDVLSEIRKEISVHFIEANRLFKPEVITDNVYDYYRKENVILPAVLTYSKELVKIIENKLAQSSAYTQELDRTFPRRLIQIMTSKNKDMILSKEEINKELVKLENKRKDLIEVGLLKPGNDVNVEPTGEIDEHTIKVLSLYIKDTQNKLNFFNDVEKKINLMTSIINKRFLNKTMKIDIEKGGFIFELPDNKYLTAEKLSSGEQNELVLIYELLFKSKPNSIILIDEPEISLHIAWQHEFLDDMIKISKLIGIKMLIATHSPDIINGRWDIAVGLGDNFDA
ncbi:AAA family ATPase [Thermoanaerobacterium sp. DL9XJH110]|uniref:AAA family ATPase n=1 Tax=Thermoanaerobacterium sp. DL9XJH110 TaxID=3386643 RepID=UPI003BB662DC